MGHLFETVQEFSRLSYKLVVRSLAMTEMRNRFNICVRASQEIFAESI
jgi:hypothetical protein